MKAVPQIMFIKNFSPGSFKIPVSKLVSAQKAQCTVPSATYKSK